MKYSGTTTIQTIPASTGNLVRLTPISPPKLSFQPRDKTAMSGWPTKRVRAWERIQTSHIINKQFQASLSMFD